MDRKTKKFCDVLSDELKRSGTSVAELAKLTGRTRTCLYYWLAHNTFDRDRVEELCRAAGLPPLSPYMIESDYQVNWLSKKRTPRTPRRGLMRQFAAIDADWERAIRLVRRYSDRSVELFEHLAEDDFVILATQTVQVMMLQVRIKKHQRMARLAARALGRGARIAFIRPDRQAIAALQEAVGLGAELIDADRFERDLADFREFARGQYARRDLTADQINQALFARLGMFAAPAVPVVMPGVTVNLFGTKAGGRAVGTRLAVRLPGDELGGLMVYPENRLFQRRVQTFARNTLDGYANGRLRSDAIESLSADQRDLQIGLARGLAADLSLTAIPPPPGRGRAE